jgi:hypothetical protein
MGALMNYRRKLEFLILFFLVLFAFAAIGAGRWPAAAHRRGHKRRWRQEPERLPTAAAQL